MLCSLLLVCLDSVSRSAAVDAAVDAHSAQHHVMGVSVAVIEKGVVSHESYRGFADQPNGLRVDRSTRMRLASISKSVTATLVLSAVQDGLIDLDEDIRKYVPEWPDKGHKITMRQILSHRSGIRHYITGRQDAGYLERTTSQALKLFQDDPLLFAPGTKYDYSTHAFTLAVAALEKVRGEKLSSLVREMSLRSGGPTLQCEDLSGTWPKWRSKHYVVRDEKTAPSGRAENLSWKYGGGGMESSAVDLAKFGYAVAQNRLLSRSITTTLWADPEKDGYALGWSVDGVIRQHSGSQQGSQSYLLVDPVKDVVVVVLTNTVPNPPGSLAKQIYQIVTN